MNVAHPVELSVLDLSVLTQGATSAEALANTTAIAKRADDLGYSRFWVAEHHNMPTIACTSPTVLIAHLAALTDRIRVGSGGVMLPNHAPLVVAEQFAMLEALHPHRIDLGIGRAPGTDQRTAAALRRSIDGMEAENFPQDLIDLMGMLGDPRAEQGMWDHFTATPAPSSSPQIFLLGSSGYSAQLAGFLGLPFAFAHHFDMGGTLQATQLYHESFQPSVVLDKPHMLVTANVIAADTTEEAEWHAGPSRISALARRTGRFSPLISPAQAAEHPEIGTATRMPTTRIVGAASDAVAQLRDLVEQTQASELMISAMTYDLSARLRSLELIAEQWPIASSLSDQVSASIDGTA